MVVLLGMGIGFFSVHEAEKRLALIEVSALGSWTLLRAKQSNAN
jgi:hypothetical protein